MVPMMEAERTNPAGQIVIEVPLGTSLREIVDIAILQAVGQCGGNLSRAARKLDVARVTVKSRVQAARAEEKAGEEI